MFGLRGPLVVIDVPGGSGPTRALGSCIWGRVEQQGGPFESRASRIFLGMQNRRKGATKAEVMVQ